MKRLQLEVHLTGRALKVYESLPASARCDYETARDSLRKQMQPVQLDSYKRSKFNSRKQQPGESVSNFAQDLQHLKDKAYVRHRLEPDLRDKILLDQFELGLTDKWKRHLKYSIETFEDALHQARLAEAVHEQLLEHTSEQRPSGYENTSYVPRSVPGSSTEERKAEHHSDQNVREPGRPRNQSLLAIDVRNQGTMQPDALSFIQLNQRRETGMRRLTELRLLEHPPPRRNMNWSKLSSSSWLLPEYSGQFYSCRGRVECRCRHSVSPINTHLNGLLLLYVQV